jgi:hypothetical protein
MQFALILLLLFTTDYRPTELVNVKKKKRRTPGLNNNETYTNNTDDKGFNDTEVNTNTNFSFNSNNNYNSTITNLSSKDGNNSSNNDVTISNN